ncbi:MAG: DUF4177 domain-containing protein [Clostridium perfringens]|nr:DUF4177 domain-containing protein [Clostridium perfringens]
MKKFEYKVAKLNGRICFTEDKIILNAEEQLNKLGKEGWELVTFKGEFAVFKKELKE